MFIGEVVGNAWGVRRHPSLQGQRLLLVRPIDPMNEKPLGEAVLALDGGVDSGPGSVVLVMDEGGSGRQMLKDDKAPVRTVICGIVDQVFCLGRVKRYA
ncbi:MAG: EutN/CcmL family microcompartment protein [Elusimicrobia bacterium]|nr:EutN/CcmL family microcompartment protein [Elusimicrobiota bacterium]